MRKLSYQSSGSIIQTVLHRVLGFEGVVGQSQDCATDTNNIRKVFMDVKETILTNELKTIGML